MMVAAVCAVQAGEYGDSAVRAARELSGAVKTGDMMWMIEKMYPPMKKQLVASFPGGEASFMETMREKDAGRRRRDEGTRHGGGDV